MKAIILCAGLGTRLRPLTFSTAKHLIPVANKPVLFYAIEGLVAVGVREIGIIVSKESKPIIQGALGDGAMWSVRFSYIEQAEPRGLAHACQCAEEFIGDEPFVMYLGDNLIPEGLSGAVARFEKSGAQAVVMLKEVPDPRAFGIAELDGDEIVRLLEKPANPPSNLAIVGGYVFQPDIFESIRRIKPSWRNEYEITDAIQNLIDRGLVVVPYVMQGWWKDAGKPDDILDANRTVLESLVADIGGACDVATVITGNVVIAPGATVEASSIKGPVIIGANARISGAEVGPFVSIGDGTEVVQSRIVNSVVMASSRIHGVRSGLRDSLIGAQVIVSGSGKDGPALRLLVGDMCEVAMD